MKAQSAIRAKTILRRALKILLWTIASVVGIFLLLALALQIPAVQNFAKNKAVDYLEGKIHTKVVISRIELGLPKKVILEGVYFEDQKKDTLLSGEKLAVDISLFELFNNKIELNSVDLKGITAHISKNEEGVFNFDYIIRAFASKEEKKDDSPPMEFAVDKISLDRVKLRYLDAVENNDIAFFVNHLDTRIKTFDLKNMDFAAPKITIDGVNLKLRQGLVETVEEVKDVVVERQKKENKILKIRLGDVELSRINIDFEDSQSQLATKIDLQKLDARFKTIDIAKGILILDNLAVSNTRGNLALGKADRSLIKNDPTTVSPTNNWKVQVNSIDFKNVDFKFDDNNYPARQGMDYRHMDLKNINLDADDLKYAANNSSGKINSFSVSDKSGLKIQALTTSFSYAGKGASLKNLYLKTPQTQLRRELAISYPSLNSLKGNPGAMGVSANINNSKVGFKDVLLLVPSLKNTNPFKSNPNGVLYINSRIEGKLRNLFIPKLEISGIGSTRVSASGRIIGLPEAEKAFFDLKIKSFQSTDKDVYRFVPPGTIPNSIRLPSQFAANGTFRGTLKNFATDLDLVSSMGNARVKTRFDRREKNRERYDAQAELDQFDLGKLIKNDSIGKITLRAGLKGVGLNPKTASATLSGDILKAGFNGYTYSNLNLDGKISRGLFEVKADTKDPNLTFKLAANGSFRDKYPSGKVRLNIDIADLNKLNLHAGPLKLRGEVDADIQSADLDYLNGQVVAKKFIIATDKDQFPLDSITITAETTAEKNALRVRSQFVDAEIDGKYKLTKIATALQNSLARYYDFNSRSPKTKSEAQQFAFKVNVKDNRILLKVLPKLKSLEPISVNGRYNSVNDTIIVSGSIPKLIYADTDITGATLNINTQDNALTYNLTVGNVKQGNFELASTILTGRASEGVLEYALMLRDLQNKERYFIAGTMKSVNGNNELTLNPANLLLNYEKWNLSQANLIRFGRNGLYASDFELTKDGSAVSLQSLNAQPNAPLELNFTNFEIGTLTSLAQKSDFEMAGTINGGAVIRNLQASPVFTSDVTVTGFAFQKEPVGDLKIQVNNETANVYAAKVELTGLDNQLSLDGNYNLATASFDLDLDIDKLQMKSLQGFTFGNIREGSGYLSGTLKITGKAAQPSIAGELKFNNVSLVATKLNSQFKMMNDKMVFSGNSIALDDFKIKDENDNNLALNGVIDSRDYANLGFDLRLDADNFKAVNSKEKDNQDFYGQLYLDNHLRIKGNMNHPVVDGTIKINKDTKLTIVLPQEDPSIADRDGIVEFIDQDQPRLFTTVDLNKELAQTQIKGIDASVNIEIDKEAELSLIIDKANGDFLKLKGDAKLTGGIDPSGKTTLTGRYELDEGAYEMSFNLIKRKFDIKKGSYILWTGEPTSADINITAVYKTETAPINLLENQLSALTAEERNTYKERIPFEAELKMKGDLMKPDISFDIILPEGNNSVSAEIIDATKVKLAQLRQDPDEMNKQVFALLLLNRFVGENPFSSETGGITASAFARDSASKVLSQQLNNLAGDLIKGFELNFDVNSYEDYTTGQKDDRTDLNVGLSKRLLNDRLKVTVGSSFGLEGEKQENQQMNNIAGDIAGEYQLSKDGRYKIRAYRKNRYQVALQGQVIESGVGFIITIDYNEFREIFRKNKKEEEKKANKEDRK